MRSTSLSIALIITASVFGCTGTYAQCGAINTGGGNCTPPTAAGMPEYGSPQAQNQQSSQASYVSQWGAIAIDKVVASAGAVIGRSSEREARRDALEDCAEKGGKHCKIMLTYDNQCAAVAWDPGMYYAASEVDPGDAKNQAMALCRAEKKSCQVVYSACSLPRRVN